MLYIGDPAERTAILIVTAIVVVIVGISWIGRRSGRPMIMLGLFLVLGLAGVGLALRDTIKPLPTNHIPAGYLVADGLVYDQNDETGATIPEQAFLDISYFDKTGHKYQVRKVINNVKNHRGETRKVYYDPTGVHSPVVETLPGDYSQRYNLEQLAMLVLGVGCIGFGIYVKTRNKA